MDYTAVDISDVRFTPGMTQIRDSDSIDVMILTDDEDEPEEIFYLNFNPTRNAIFLPPTIEIKICGSKHKFLPEVFSSILQKCTFTLCSLVDLTAFLYMCCTLHVHVSFVWLC